MQVPSIFVIVFTSTSLLRITFVALWKPCQGNFGKFPRSSETRFGGSKKDRWFLKIPKWQHKLARYHKRGRLLSYFLNNAAKTCLYGLKISENIEIGHVFQPGAFLHRSSNLDTSYLSAFKFCWIVVDNIMFEIKWFKNSRKGNTLTKTYVFRKFGVIFLPYLSWSSKQ